MALARQGVTPQNEPSEPIKMTDDARIITQKVFHNTIEILQDTITLLDYNEMERAYDVLKNTRKVLVIALAVSRTFAIYAADKLSFFGIEAQAETDLYLQTLKAAMLKEGDVLLALSRSGDTRDIIAATQIAKEKGAVTIGIIGNPRSYFAKVVDIKLFVKSKDTRFRDDLLASRIEHIAVVDTLYTMLAARNRERGEHYHSMLIEAEFMNHP